MAITYDWIFNPLTVKPVEGSLTDVVITVDWRRYAVDGNYYASSVYGQVSLGPPNPSDYTASSDDSFTSTLGISYGKASI